MDKVAGRKLKQALEDVGAPEDMKKAAVAALRSVRIVQRKAQKEFEFLRNATIAHRDPDAIAQYQAISKLDELRVMELAGDFYTAADAFVGLMPKVIAHASTLPNLLKQFGKAQKATKGA